MFTGIYSTLLGEKKKKNLALLKGSCFNSVITNHGYFTALNKIWFKFDMKKIYLSTSVQRVTPPLFLYCVSLYTPNKFQEMYTLWKPTSEKYHHVKP